MAADAVALRVVVTGRVQGVGFRASTRERARAAGIAGWVRNLPDGSVEAHLQGAAASVEEVAAWMERGGPPAGRVDAVDRTPAAPDAALSSFDVRHG